jgi:hypothetical protein
LTFDITENGFADDDAFKTAIHEISSHNPGKFQEPGASASYPSLAAVSARRTG